MPVIKRSLDVKPVNSRLDKPIVAQARACVSPQRPSPIRKSPLAPPVYHPDKSPMTVQTKMSNAVKQKQPVAPAVYNPQPLARVLQRRILSGQQSLTSQGPKLPVAPPVYRPQTKVFGLAGNPAITPARANPKAPPVFRSIGARHTTGSPQQKSSRQDVGSTLQRSRSLHGVGITKIKTSQVNSGTRVAAASRRTSPFPIQLKPAARAPGNRGRSVVQMARRPELRAYDAVLDELRERVVGLIDPNVQLQTTDDFAADLPVGTPIPPGEAFGVTVGGNGAPVCIYISKMWMDKWSGAERRGNLINIIRHEAAHGAQRLHGGLAKSNDWLEFAAYYREIDATYQAIQRHEPNFEYPTYPQLAKAYKAALDHFEALSSKDHLRLTAQYNKLVNMWMVVRVTLPALKSTHIEGNQLLAVLNDFRDFKASARAAESADPAVLTAIQKKGREGLRLIANLNPSDLVTLRREISEFETIADEMKTMQANSALGRKYPAIWRAKSKAAVPLTAAAPLPIAPPPSLAPPPLLAPPPTTAPTPLTIPAPLLAVSDEDFGAFQSAK
jgi:hypothetical protein